jgi:hypothetical protein|nr:MAG TPA: hypothetical protein [Caudoviricetes sp.]
MKTFIINWHPNEKYGTVIDRKSIVKTKDAQSAVTAFMKANGNLKKNTINFIQEIDGNGIPIGDKIIPD